MATVATKLELSQLKAQFRSVALPEKISELAAEPSGIVRLPQILAWSGMREFDVEDPYYEKLYYERVLNEAGDVKVLQRFLNGDRLQKIWHSLYPAMHVKFAWENKFPMLKEDSR